MSALLMTVSHVVASLAAYAHEGLLCPPLCANCQDTGDMLACLHHSSYCELTQNNTAVSSPVLPLSATGASLF